MFKVRRPVQPETYSVTMRINHPCPRSRGGGILLTVSSPSDINATNCDPGSGEDHCSPYLSCLQAESKPPSQYYQSGWNQIDSEFVSTTSWRTRLWCVWGVGQRERVEVAGSWTQKTIRRMEIQNECRLGITEATPDTAYTQKHQWFLTQGNWSFPSECIGRKGCAIQVPASPAGSSGTLAFPGKQLGPRLLLSPEKLVFVLCSSLCTEILNQILF